jgi:hypothetical protein
MTAPSTLGDSTGETCTEHGERLPCLECTTNDALDRRTSAPMMNTCPVCDRHDVNLSLGDGAERCDRCEDAWLRARVARLESALEPFAAIGDNPDKPFEDYSPAARFTREFTQPEVAAARAALAVRERAT